MSIRATLSSRLAEVSWHCAKGLAPHIGRRTDRGMLRPVVVVAPSAPGSYGDEAMVAVLAAQLQETGRDVVLVSFGGRSWAKNLGFGIDGQRLDSKTSGLRHLTLLRHAHALYCIGADVLDGKYSVRRTVQRLDFVGMAARMGVPSNIVSFSLNEDPTPAVCEAWLRLPTNVRLVARDQRSANRVAALIKRPVPTAADLAFLLKGQAQRPDLPERLIGVAPNHQHAPIFGDTQKYVDVLAGALRQVLDSYPGHTVATFAHDIRGTVSDTHVAHEVADRLGDRALYIPTDGPASARGVMGACELVITGRMHAAIGALAEGVPVLVFGYQGKVEGMLEHFKLRELCVPPEMLRDPTALSREIRDIRGNQAIRDQIVSTTEAVTSLAFRNFDPVHLMITGDSKVPAR